MNNAALERLASVTDRVQARPVPSALEKRQPKRSVSLEGDHPVMQQKKWSPRRRR
ncbi:hypothetical protein K7G95_22325 [Escherichia coli]|nr:hypothetical protein K7G95_22325 [Escherichia coli]